MTQRRKEPRTLKREKSLYFGQKHSGRLVTKTELAAVIGKKKLSPSYFIKYPELGRYVKSFESKTLSEYQVRLSKWLQENNIPYKPNDRTLIKAPVDMALLGEYSNIALILSERPAGKSSARHMASLRSKYEKAEKAGVILIMVDRTKFEDLDKLKSTLDSLKLKNK